MASLLNRYSLALAAGLFLAPAMACAATITGTVTNKTVNKPSAGDDVVLIRFAQGMQEATRTKTDSRGHYSLDVTDDGLHLIRVTHDKANYFKPAQPGVSTVDVDVFNAAARVKGVSAEADVMRLQTDESGKTLRVVENFFVKNDSSPPMTQFGERAFEFYLPAGAVVEGSAALAPGGMPVQAAPVPLGDANHYSFIFPIRPGETRFQITYHVAYSGSLALAPRPMLPTDTVAVMMPKSMEFKANGGSPYTSISDEVNAQTFVARNVQPSQALGFTLSGTRTAAAGHAGADGGWRRRCGWAGGCGGSSGCSCGSNEVRGAGWGTRLIRERRMIPGRSIGGGFLAGWGWHWRQAPACCCGSSPRVWRARRLRMRMRVIVRHRRVRGRCLRC